MIAFGRRILSKTGKLASSYADRTPGYAKSQARNMQSHAASSGVTKATKSALSNRGVQATLAGGYVGGSFLSGIDSDRQVTNSLYDLAFGDPNYDEYVMGRSLSTRQLMAPLPGERFTQSTIKPGLYTGAAGGIIGGLGGLALTRSPVGAVAGGLIGAAGAGAAGQIYTQSKMGGGAVLTPTTFKDAYRSNRTNRRDQPMVDGSVAFGMYNARLG